MSVPTHYYKVVLAKGLQSRGRQRPQGAGAAADDGGGDSGGGGGAPQADVGVAAFVMPNAPIDAATPLSAFVVPLEPLEAVAGATRDRSAHLFVAEQLFTWAWRWTLVETKAGDVDVRAPCRHTLLP